MPENSMFRRKAILSAGIVTMFLGGCSQEHSHMQVTGFTQADVSMANTKLKSSPARIATQFARLTAFIWIHN